MSPATQAPALASEAAGLVVSAPVDPRSLAGRSFAELGALFAGLTVPHQRIEGLLRGRMVALIGVERLAPGARRSAMRLVQALAVPVWRGKRFAGSEGANAWLRADGSLTFAAYAVAEGAGLDGAPAIVLDYDVPANPAPVRGILGEARALGPGLYLGRMSYRLRSRTVHVQYFTLEA